MEKLFEYKKYQQGIVITDRMDYLNPLGNNLAYVMAAEKLLDLEIPQRAQTIRVLFCELQRIASHMVWLGTHALDIGAMSVFFYCFRQREKILNLIEAASGGRMTPSYFRIGGLMMDLRQDSNDAASSFRMISRSDGTRSKRSSRETPLAESNERNGIISVKMRSIGD
jgi:NADH-quinone oxidoreductase subunit D